MSLLFSQVLFPSLTKLQLHRICFCSLNIIYSFSSKVFSWNDFTLLGRFFVSRHHCEYYFLREAFLTIESRVATSYLSCHLILILCIAFTRIGYIYILFCVQYFCLQLEGKFQECRPIIYLIDHPLHFFFIFF